MLNSPAIFHGINTVSTGLMWWSIRKLPAAALVPGPDIDRNFCLYALLGIVIGVVAVVSTNRHSYNKLRLVVSCYPRDPAGPFVP